MILLWYTLALSVQCIYSTEIPLDRAEQSGNYNANQDPAYAIDNNLQTTTETNFADPAWIKIYFKDGPREVNKLISSLGEELVLAHSALSSLSSFNVLLPSNLILTLAPT